ncbi:alpha-D-glucose phosphate-specific phosphoglucomutase [Sinimarinibacterium sp. CAU 1509]|uniref:alpha-D-glucose phosphate-specific phosphoglucomutase n=1 Tax=Sinimarinibacterium sp. CAU 1509 TaxID=2562283 RepID=UPI0010ACA6A8|nr:alpha-D-glucose phosphate-specific phosphoglucomutase [Sinimarinibacterium sp. CAU 1509]TJY62150.1 alpha-D-glucose phosphate-specific phosphoglucomutase [Sinimarinibacterium sp. CAU 1509]
MPIREITTKPYLDQKPGTAGLRKKVTVFQQPHYLENFLQSIFDCAPEIRGATLVIGGDGRYHNRDAIRTAISMAAANGVRHIVVGQGGLLSTPAASNLIRKRGAAGGLLFTASHNPAGPDGDFGVKFNIAGGGQAGEGLTDRIYQQSKSITRYRNCDDADIDLDRRGEQTLEGTTIEIVDCVDDYAALMQSLFDFDRMRDWIKKGHSLRFDAMHAVTGPYAQRILVEQLGAPAGAILNANPLPDFGGGHPDPNLVYGKHLVDLAFGEGAPELLAASDGDGDRNMILGRGIFISPGDSLAMLAANLPQLPGYRDGLRGIARSMPTSRAADRVAKELKVPLYETPTGWKFFCNLLDAGNVTICGEESFGTSSSHAREKDGLWAVLAWLNVLAISGRSVREIAEAHWQHYGRHYFARHDYDELPATHAEAVMQAFAGSLASLQGQQVSGYEVTTADEFSYQDRVDGSIAVAQGLRVVCGEQARIVMRLSGTGTQGATLRVYLERYEKDPSAQGWNPAEALAPLAAAADQLARISALTGRKAPSLVT